MSDIDAAHGDFGGANGASNGTGADNGGCDCVDRDFVVIVLIMVIVMVFTVILAS